MSDMQVTTLNQPLRIATPTHNAFAMVTDGSAHNDTPAKRARIAEPLANNTLNNNNNNDGPSSRANYVDNSHRNHSYLERVANFFAPNLNSPDNRDAPAQGMDVQQQTAYEDIVESLKGLQASLIHDQDKTLMQLRKTQIALLKCEAHKAAGTLPKNLCIAFNPGNPFPKFVKERDQYLEDMKNAFNRMLQDMFSNNINILELTAANLERDVAMKFSEDNIRHLIVEMASPISQDPRFDSLIEETLKDVSDALQKNCITRMEKYANLDKQYQEKQQKKLKKTSAQASQSRTSASSTNARGDTGNNSAQSARSISDATNASDFEKIIDEKISEKFDELNKRLDTLLNKKMRKASKKKNNKSKESSRKVEIVTETDTDNEDDSSVISISSEETSPPSANIPHGRRTYTPTRFDHRRSNGRGTQNGNNSIRQSYSDRTGNENPDNRFKTTRNDSSNKNNMDVAKRNRPQRSQTSQRHEEEEEEGEWQFVSYSRGNKNRQTTQRQSPPNTSTQNAASARQGNGWGRNRPQRN